jgi:UDP-3-O-[3-hydroxymyristoyl] glucosamine N-acyltransferase
VHRLGDLAGRIGGSVRGDSNRVVAGIATLEDAGPDDLAFLTNPRYRRQAAETRAGALLVGPGVEIEGKDLLVAAEPYLALAELLELFHPSPPQAAGVSPLASIAPTATLGAEVLVRPFAVIGDSATIGARSTIGAGAIVGEGATVGDDTVLYPRVVLYPATRVGSRCILHAGVVLGADGFGFATSKGKHRKVPQLGRVVVEDDVEIGAQSAVDRGTLGDTVIGRGTKIDDLVMVAHGVRVGSDCLLVAQSGVAGSSRLGRGVVLAGQAGVAGHLRLGDGAMVAAKSAVFDDVPDHAFVAGIPATDHRAWKKAQAALKRLPGLRAEVRALRQRVEKLEKGRD